MPVFPASPDALDDALVRAIAAQGPQVRFPAHAVIISEGDRADSLYIILSGRVKVFSSNEAGKEVVINTHGPGEYVGELALDGGPRSASVMTLEPTTCSVVMGADLRRFIAAQPDFAMHLIYRLPQAKLVRSQWRQMAAPRSMLMNDILHQKQSPTQ